MKFPESWLREFVDPPVDRDELCRRLTMAGLEVEVVDALGAGLDGVVVGEIVDCASHPNADKLRVCQVSIGKDAPLQIVCGAPNARAGLKAPLATIGAQLPNGIEIKKAALRGVESNGMLCSAQELALDADASGLLELPADAPVGKRLAEYLALPDARIELKLTPNRPDCLGLRGLAHDVAALFDVAVNEASATPVAAVSAASREVHLDAGAECPRYVGRVIEGVQAAAKSPLWLAERLRRSGIRPISAIVDVTQYVMLELGQPMHAYDMAALDGAIQVRRARADETVKLLDGNEHTLAPDFLVIADGKNAVGLAGIMGGFDSRVVDATRDIFLEAAHFAPAAIMGRARKLGLHTDASHRFERGVDSELPRLAMERATRLILDICGGKPGPVVETTLADALPKAVPLKLRRARLARVLGIDIADAEVERILGKLDMRVEKTAEGWRVTPPSRRFDIAIEEDLIEEIARIHGYDRVPRHAPGGELHLHLPSEAELSPARLRAQLAARGYREAICMSFVARDLLERWSLDGGSVALANPLSTDLAVMRTSLLPGLVEALKYNRNRQQERVRLFETGLVFRTDGELKQIPRLAAVACGRAAPEGWATAKRDVDFFDLKADLETLVALAGGDRKSMFESASEPWLHPGRSAWALIDGKLAAIVGMLHPRLLKTLDLDCDVYVFEADLAVLTAGKVPRSKPISVFPMLRRDIAVVVPEAIDYAAIESCVREAVGQHLTEVIVFDRYSGQNLGSGTKSLAIGLILQDDSRTLTVEDADRCVAQAVAVLESQCQAKLRG
ncbi:MAG: phenylalanine--tRNA ligase subunit beta [Xanthomonadaceae bacterium]|nr:phenylalanine--tRNA ligase subunit beta [Xanthomonadaceae bacterium]